MASLALAIGFMTRLPVGRRSRFGGDALSRAAVWFPVVGLLVGAAMAATRDLAGLALDRGPATVLALVAAVVITGGLHEDGLADCADAIGAHVGRARRLEILHDPRLGTYGTLALMFAVLLAVVTLTPLGDDRFLRAAVVANTLGRWSTLPLSLALPPAAPGGSGALVRVGGTVALAGSAVAVGISLAVCGPSAGAVALAVAALVTVAGGVIAWRALRGVTGDVFGAVTKLVEVGAYAALAATW
jgi:adenosylcobinamide-GDP ribazoletransferase